MKLLAAVCLFALVACGSEPRVDSRSPQEIVDQASIHLTPDSEPTLALPAPQSRLSVVASSDQSAGVGVSAEVTAISVRGPSGEWNVLDPQRQTIVMIEPSPDSTLLHTYASLPLRFSTRYRPQLEHEGVMYFGAAIDRAYCVGD